jgi:hypothetical protein
MEEHLGSEVTDDLGQRRSRMRATPSPPTRTFAGATSPCTRWSGPLASERARCRALKPSSTSTRTRKSAPREGGDAFHAGSRRSASHSPSTKSLSTATLPPSTTTSRTGTSFAWRTETSARAVRTTASDSSKISTTTRAAARGALVLAATYLGRAREPRARSSR